MARKLPRFEPIGLIERRALWVKYREQRDVQRLLLELAHASAVMSEIEDYFGAVQRAWSEQNQGQLVALEKIRVLLREQGLRLDVLAGLKPPPRDGEPDEPEPALVD